MKKNIAVYIQGDTVWEAAMLSEIQRFAGIREDWTLFLFRVFPDFLPAKLDVASIHGALIPSHLAKEAAALQQRNVPYVSLGHDAVHGGGSVVLDNVMAGRLAARHLVAEGYTRLVYFANGMDRHSPTRAHGFVDEVKLLGRDTEIFQEGPRQRRALKWSLSLQLQDFSDLLLSSSQPVGVFTNDDVHGERALEACRLVGLRVPEDVGICCFTTNDLFCSLCSPPLSSVSFDMAALGKQAVTVLANMLEGKKTSEREVILLPPQAMRVRHSSQFRMVRSPAVAKFLAYLESHYAEPVDFNASARASGLSRSSLERQVRQVTGLTPAQCLKRLRVQECKRLLLETDMDLETIAAETGFSDKSVLSRVIKAETGQSPGKFRRS